MKIERLESRIAPAKLVGNLLTFTDIDGDLVKVTLSGETPAMGDFVFAAGFLPNDVTTPQSLTSVTLTKDGAGLILTATPQHRSGDSHANVSLIDGGIHDLGTVRVDGDVSAIDAGSGSATVLGIKSFTALSLGKGFTPSSQSNLTSAGTILIRTDVVNHTLTVTGGLKSLTIGGDLEETIDGSKATVNITGNVGTLKIGGSVIGRSGAGANLKIGGNVTALTIGGSIIGGSANIPQSGGGVAVSQVGVGGTAGKIAIGGSLTGGAGQLGGALFVTGHVGAITVGGSVKGGAGQFSGLLNLTGGAGTLGITGSIVGGPNVDTGFVGGGSIANVKIGGSILGGPIAQTGALSGASFGTIVIGHDIVGGDGANNDIFESGEIRATGNIGSITLGGDLVAGRAVGSGKLSQDGFIAAGGTIGAIKIGGSIRGDSTNSAQILADGLGITGAIAAIKSLTVKGSVERATIAVGYEGGDADAGIGAVSIGGSLAGSYIFAGASVGADMKIGTADDVLNPASLAAIASIKVGGSFTGLAEVVTQFRIAAPKLVKLTVGHAIYSETQLAAPGGVALSALGFARAECLS